MSSHLPKSVTRLIEEFSRLPGIGPKTAERLTFHLLRSDERKPCDLGDALLGLKKGILLCEECFNFCTESPCELCSNVYREKNIICVVEEPLDIVAIEKTHKYKGLYHVLHGAISPIDGIGPDNLKIAELIHRVKKSRPHIDNSSFVQVDSHRTPIDELILATSLSLQGEATAQYIYNALRSLTTDRPDPASNAFHGLPADRHGLTSGQQIHPLRITRIAKGLPVGGNLEYADVDTIGSALIGRKEF